MILVGEPVIIIRGAPGGFDEYGDPTAGTETRRRVTSLAPLAFMYATENDDRGRAGVITGAKVYLPRGTDLRSTDRLEVRGVVYEVDGEVADWRSPTGDGMGGVEAALRRTAG